MLVLTLREKTWVFIGIQTFVFNVSRVISKLTVLWCMIDIFQCCSLYRQCDTEASFPCRSPPVVQAKLTFETSSIRTLETFGQWTLLSCPYMAGFLKDSHHNCQSMIILMLKVKFLYKRQSCYLNYIETIWLSRVHIFSISSMFQVTASVPS